MAIAPLIFLSLVIVGFFIGIAAAMVGIGGGALMVPVLMFFYSLSATQASATSSFVIIFTAGSGSFTYWRQKRIDFRSGFFLVIVAIPFAFIGAFLAESIDENFLTIIFGTFLIIMAIQRIFTKPKARNTSISTNIEISEGRDNANPVAANFTRSQLLPKSIENRLIVDDKGEEFQYQVNLSKVIKWGFVGGLVAGLLGVGGGVIFVPTLTEIGGLPPHIAIATSTFVTLFSALSSTMGRVLFGESIIYEYALPLALGTVLGARIGASSVRRVSAQRILNIFYFIVLFVGVRAILRGFGII